MESEDPRDPSTRRLRGDSRSGFSLLEVVAALTILSGVLLAVGMTLMHGMRQRSDSFEVYRAISAIRDLVAEIQDCANDANDLAAGRGIASIYSRYHDVSVVIPDLPSGEINVTCFASEQTVPVELGGPQDLNFDGDDQDDLANISVGTDLRVVPMTLTLTFSDAGFTQTLTIHRLIGLTRSG